MTDIMQFINVFRGPVYKCFMIFGDSRGMPLWNYEQWLKIADALDGVFSVLKKSISVQSGQLVKPSKRTRKEEEVHFGRLTWDKSSFQEWCHHSPKTIGICDEWDFVDVEVFSPSWEECAANGATRPILYVKCRDDSYREDDFRQLYDQLCIVAVRDYFWRRNKEHIERCVRQIATNVSGLRVVACDKVVMSLNAFESIFLDSVYRGMHSDPLPDPSKMKGHWREVSL